VNEVASFGQNLRQAREARNITLQEITAATKIGTRALQALEDERFDQLPGGIFNKGFVRAYARFVGLDEEKTVAAYMAAAKTPIPETDMQVLSTQVSAARKGTHEPWPVKAGIFVGVLAVVVALVLGGLWLKERRKEAEEPTAAQTESPVASQTAPVSVPPQVTASDPNATTGANTAANSGPNATPTAVQGTDQSASQAGNPAQVATQVAKQAPAAPVEISISATARAWISVLSDGKRVEQLVLDPDKPEMRSRTYNAQQKLLLIVGNPSGVSVTYNGKPAGTLGIEGRRATITFTPQGMEKR
jgi:cytoskeleton protein RodZ